MDSLRQNLVDAVIARMETILVVNGYQTDIGTNVHDFETNFDEDELPAISVADLIEYVDEANSTDEATYTLVMPFQIRIFASENERPAQIRKMIADVTRSIGEDRNWTVDGFQLAEKTEYKRGGFVIPDDAFKIAGAVVEIEISYLVKQFDPYE